MLLRFRFSNFRSFRTEQELSLAAGPFTDQPEVVLHPTGVREGVLPVAAIYGANASGKTNVIRAVRFMVSAVESSHRIWKPDDPIPREPFLADERSRGEPSSFELDFLAGGKRYQYGFRVDSEAVLEEWLFAYPSGKRQTWYRRAQGRPISFGAMMPGENRTIENLTRKNSLFLSAAAQNNHDALLPIYTSLTSLLFVIGNRALYHHQTTALCSATDYKSDVSNLIAGADLGIVGLCIEEAKVPDRTIELLEAVAKVLNLEHKDRLLGGSFPEIRLLHRFGNKEVPFEISQESDGTIAYLSLLGPAVDALKKGATLFVDELDASLHPLLAIQLTRLFNTPSSNPKSAQLIFNTHDTNLLSSGVLRRDQIWFTEKNDDANSQLYPLSDFKPRRQENLQNGYLQGRYGAIPFINPDSFLLQFEADNVEA